MVGSADTSGEANNTIAGGHIAAAMVYRRKVK